ncbi:MAG: tetratricopeptide repeat protein, partial [Candidatus Margulisbacteria bacterium]|nr:tetratricopeptide repeat protein [Candidatus Margulisiibacteriota bacterium]
EAYYRPLVTLSLMLDAQWGGTAPWAYHLTNLILHLLVSCLVFLFFINIKYKRDLAFLFSLVFAVHPLLTDAVAWIPGRNDLLLAVFTLSSFIGFVRFIETKRWPYYWGHLVLFFLALLTKEAAIVLVPLVFFYLHFIAREKLFSFNGRLFAAGWLAAVVPWFLLRQAVLTNPLKMTVEETGKSLLQNLPVAVQYLGKIFLPFNLSVLPTIRDTSFVYGILSLCLLGLGWLLTKHKRHNFIFFGLFWSLLFVLPSLIINFSVIPTHLENRMYLPIIGVLLVLLEIEPVKNLNLRKRGALVYCTLLLAVLSSITLIYSGSFADRISFWQNAVRTSPHSPLAHRNLGAMYFLEGSPDKAEPEYRAALDLNPAEPMAHNNLGLIYMDQGKLSAAEIEFISELKVNPLYDNALFNLGLLYARQGRIGQAKDLWEKTLEVNPQYVDAQKYLRLIHDR